MENAISVGKIVTLVPKNEYQGVTKRDVVGVTGVLDKASSYEFEKKEGCVFLSLSTMTKFVCHTQKGIEEKTSVAMFYDYSLSEYVVREATGIEIYSFVKRVWEAKDTINKNASNALILIFDRLKELYGLDIEALYKSGEDGLNSEKYDVQEIVRREEEREKNGRSIVLPIYNQERMETLMKERRDIGLASENTHLNLYIVSFYNRDFVYVLANSYFDALNVVRGWLNEKKYDSEVRSIEFVATTRENIEWLPKLINGAVHVY